MKRPIRLVPIFLLFFSVFLSENIHAQNSDITAIKNLLLRQRDDWNKGNVTNFMKGYWESDSLLFIGKAISNGYQETLDNYKKSYPDVAAMGHLDFEFVEFRKLSAEYYFVIGKWHLKRSIGNVGGAYTLLFRKIKGNWTIVVDHSS
jgi:ketosteroid isomerase-like protein